jgi:hypothetical protein
VAGGVVGGVVGGVGRYSWVSLTDALTDFFACWLSIGLGNVGRDFGTEMSGMTVGSLTIGMGLSALSAEPTTEDASLMSVDDEAISSAYDKGTAGSFGF